MEQTIRIIKPGRSACFAVQDLHPCGVRLTRKRRFPMLIVLMHRPHGQRKRLIVANDWCVIVV
jgi:hypothetical protein